MMRDFVEIAAHAAEIAGVLIIIGGMVFAAARYAFVRAGDGLARYKRCRHDLGRAILLGLGILLAADIISTVTLTPTVQSVLVLGIIVVIRTFLSWSLAPSSTDAGRGSAARNTGRYPDPGNAFSHLIMRRILAGRIVSASTAATRPALGRNWPGGKGMRTSGFGWTAACGLLALFLFSWMASQAAHAQTSRPVGPTMCACPGKHKALGNAKTCEEACYGTTPGNTGSTSSRVYTPPIDYEAQRRAREAEEQAEREQQAADDRRRKEDAERQARFIRDRDAAAGTLRGSIGTSVGANSARGMELRGSQVDTGIREARPDRGDRDLGGQQAAWKQLHCAASILGPALSALKIDASAGVKADYSEFRYLADEALNALNGKRLGVACAKAPDMPRYSGPATDPARQAEVERGLVEKTRSLAAKLEEGRRKQADAQATLRQASAPAPAAAGGVADAVERQRQINRARDNAAKEMAKAQRDFNEGKRSEESAKKELKKIQEKVESVVQGERVMFDEDPPAAPRRSASSEKK